jgi:hypothetical protein
VQETSVTWRTIRETLTRPYPVTIPMVILVLLVPVYLVIDDFSPNDTLSAPFLPLDRLIPLQPVRALIYGPVWGLRFLYDADPPYHCFPSLHVARSFVSALTCYRAGCGARSLCDDRYHCGRPLAGVRVLWRRIRHSIETRVVVRLEKRLVGLKRGERLGLDLVVEEIGDVVVDAPGGAVVRDDARSNARIARPRQRRLMLHCTRDEDRHRPLHARRMSGGRDESCIVAEHFFER